MDEARRVRFLVPPFFLFLSIGTGLTLSGFDFACIVENCDLKGLLAVLGLIVAAMFPVGYLVSAVSIICLRLLVFSFGWKTYESHLTDDAFRAVWERVRASEEANREWELYAVATYDHGQLPSGVHAWLQRRWSSFNVSAHSVTALALSFLAAAHPAVTVTSTWLVLASVAMLLLGATAKAAWHQTMNMLEFQTKCRPSPGRRPRKATRSSVEGRPRKSLSVSTSLVR